MLQVNGDNPAIIQVGAAYADLGATIQLASGVAANDRVIESPPDGIANGDPVQIAVTDPKTGKPTNAGNGRATN